MRYLIQSACCSNIGKVRENNEDNFYFNGKYLKEDHTNSSKILTTSFSNEDNMIFAVFDGMGGEAYGEKASFLAANALDTYIKEHQEKSWSFSDYIEDANRLILKNNIGNNRMGTTIAAASFLEDNIKFCNIGDSRIYLYRNGELKQISMDHTSEELLKSIDSEKKHSSILTQHLGIEKDEMELSPYLTKTSYQAKDKILICSDGLTNMLTNNEIATILSENISCKESVERLLSKALNNGGIDNITIMEFIVEKEKKKKGLAIILTFLFIFSIISIILINHNSFEIQDECDNLVVNESCSFSFNDKKYTIEITDPSIIKYQNSKIIALSSGSTNVTIYHHKKEVYTKKIKVFPN